jgi:hypothetical protein
MPVLTTLKSTADPGDYFEVTTWIPVTLQIQTLAGCEFDSDDNFTNRNLLEV